MIKRLAVGAELESYCGRCKMVLNHIIGAMVGPVPRRVKCLTCGSEHNHRLPTASRSRVVATAGKSKSRAKSSKPNPISRWYSAIESWDDTAAKKYNIYDSFLLNDWITHSKFGRGLVIDVPSPDRMITLFETGEKMLMHGKTRV